MRARLLKLWQNLRASFWFVPGGMAIAAVVLAGITLDFDLGHPDGADFVPSWIYEGGADGASTIVGTIASSMTSIAGVVFSITLVALSLASSQFGPRMLRNYMRDTSTQIVMGSFVATFLYGLLVLRAIRHGDEFVPHVSVSCAMLMALISLALLIHFIHHVSMSIQADQVVAAVGTDLLQGIDRLCLPGRGAGVDAAPGSSLHDSVASAAQPLFAQRDGYLQLIDEQALLALARHAGCVIELSRRPGDYLIAGSPLGCLWPAGGAGSEGARLIDQALVLGNERTDAQDVGFAIDQLVEIAVRALSPGINDPFTAITCIDRLGSGIARLAGHTLPAWRALRDDGVLRVNLTAPTFGTLVDAAFDPIRENARGTASVSLRMLETMTQLTPSLRTVTDCETIERHARLLNEACQASLPEAGDRARVEVAAERCLAGLARRRAELPANPAQPESTSETPATLSA